MGLNFSVKTQRIHYIIYILYTCNNIYIIYYFEKCTLQKQFERHHHHQTADNLNAAINCLFFFYQIGHLKTTRTSWSLSWPGRGTARTKSSSKSVQRRTRSSRTHRWVPWSSASLFNTHWAVKGNICMWYFKYQTPAGSFFPGFFASATSGYFHCGIVVWMTGCLSSM